MLWELQRCWGSVNVSVWEALVEAEAAMPGTPRCCYRKTDGVNQNFLQSQAILNLTPYGRNTVIFVFNAERDYNKQQWLISEIAIW